jgi:hypothetical protein
MRQNIFNIQKKAIFNLLYVLNPFLLHFCLDTAIFYLWKQLNPNSDINQYELDFTDIFGSQINLKTASIAKIFQIVGFKFKCFFKILILENNTNNKKIYHFNHCSCLESKNTKLLFTNKIYLSQKSHTFFVLDKKIYVSKNEIYGRTTLQTLDLSYLSSTLPSNKNLIFFYSYCKDQIYCILNYSDDDQYYSVEIIKDNYLITPIDKPNYINKFHLTYDMVLPFLPKKEKKDISSSQPCLCFMEEIISLRPLGYKELKTNIQMMLHSMNLYVQFKPIFLFLSRLKMISYDIETQYR